MKMESNVIDNIIQFIIAITGFIAIYLTQQEKRNEVVLFSSF